MDINTEKYTSHSLEEEAVCAILCCDNLEEQKILLNQIKFHIRSPQALYGESSRDIFKAMISLLDKETPCRVGTVSKELERQGKATDETLAALKRIDTTTYRTFEDGIAAAEQVQSLYRVRLGVAELAKMNRRIELGKVETVDDLVDWHSSQMDKLRSLQSGDRYDSASQVAHIRSSYNDRLEGGSFVDTGINAVDKVVGGLHNPSFTVLMARTGIGKTTLLASISANMMAKENAIVLFYPCESSIYSLAAKILSARDNLGLSGDLPPTLRQMFLQKPHLLPESKRTEVTQRFGKQTMWLEKQQFFIKKPGFIDLGDVERDLSYFRAQHPERTILVCIDYLQRSFDPDRRGNSSKEQVEAAAAKVNSICHKHKAIVIGTAQVTDYGTSKIDKMPFEMASKEQVRHSKELLNDAYSVWSFNRPWAAAGDERKYFGILEVTKNRMGDMGHVLLDCDLSSVKFDWWQRRAHSLYSVEDLTNEVGTKTQRINRS